MTTEFIFLKIFLVTACVNVGESQLTLSSEEIGLNLPTSNRHGFT